MLDSELTESEAHCVCQMKTKEENTRVSTNIDVQYISCQEAYVHYYVETQDPPYICHYTDKENISVIAKPNQYKIPGVHLEDNSHRKNCHQEINRKSCCSGRKFAYFEGATFPQVMATMVMSLIQIQAGTVFGFSGVTLPQLTDTATKDLFLDPHHAALFGSLVNLGSVAGTCLNWPLLVRFGQRNTLLLGLPLSLLAWLTLILSPNIWLLQVARFILGLTMSLLGPAANMYLLEISHRKIRGRLLGTMTLSRNLGGLILTLIGNLSLSWRHVGLLCSTFSVLPILGVFFLPNSPRWLITQDRLDEACSALLFFRKKDYDHMPELNAITKQVESKTGTGDSIWGQIKILFQSQTLNYFGVLSLMTISVAFCGCFSLVAYLVPIMQATHNDSDPYLIAVIYNAVKIIGNIIHLGAVDKFGRKPLTIVSFLLCSVCTTIYATYYYLLNMNTITDTSWVPLSVLILFSLFYSVGIPVIPVLYGELLPTNCRAAGVSLLTCLLMVGVFTSTHTYYVTTTAIGLDGAFWLYSSFSILLVLVTIFGLPETRGQTLEDISSPRLGSKDTQKSLWTNL